MAIRKIPIQNRSVAGRFFSIKNNSLIDFESQLEKKHFLLLEFDNNVISYEPQPLKVNNYIPDILIQIVNNKNILAEVKYSDEAFNPDEKLQRKFNTLEEYAKKNNLEFKVLTEKDIQEPYFANISLIYNYANIEVDSEIRKDILKKIPKNGISISDFLVKYNNDIKYISYLYSLVFKQYIEINFYKKISYNSIIRLSND